MYIQSCEDAYLSKMTTTLKQPLKSPFRQGLEQKLLYETVNCLTRSTTTSDWPVTTSRLYKTINSEELQENQ